jgi:ABC-type antimicrobial peptide transport system permease subunit
VGQLPGVEGVAFGSFAPWRDAGMWPQVRFTVEGYQPADGEENPYARLRFVAPSFFAMLGVPLLAVREFTDSDQRDSEPVSIVSQSLARRMFPNGDALNRKLSWASSSSPDFIPSRIVGVVADVDDENVVAEPTVTAYFPVAQIALGGRLFVRAAADPYALVPEVTRVIRAIAPEQAVERAATLEDVRAEVLSPERLNTFVFSGFAGIALLVAVVGVTGVLAFSVSARTREFGVRLVVGSTPRQLLASVLSDGVRIAAIGIAVGAAGGYTLARLAEGFFEQVQMPGTLAVVGAATVLIGAAMVASLMPAARAARVNVIEALRSE